MKRILTLAALVLFADVYASHIVGGEFELLHLTGHQYRLNLIWYFDVVNNPNRVPEAQEPSVDVYIFRKRDDAPVRTVRLTFLAPKTRVQYTQPECSSGELITDRLVYTTIVVLTADEFGDPEGYYISWERCCRNYNILNIISQNPTIGGIGAGQTFYYEFSPVVKNGQQFINSSPRNFPTLADYACPGKPYYVNFAGIDDDGDSLAYSLVTPLNTHNVAPIPGAFPRPYPLVQWQQGFGLDKIVNGSPVSASYPDLRISTEGFLRVTPKSLGTYVFAVRIEEFRDKEKIGETRRDFQMLVVDCKVSVPPKITGRRLNDPPETRISGNMSVSFANTVPDEERCIIVRVTDEDAKREADDFTEFIRVDAVALNFRKNDLPELLPVVQTGLIHNEESIEFRICFPKCPYFEGGAYQIGIVAFDDACALPLSDTLKIAVTVEPPHNERAQFVTADVNAVLQEGDKMIWPFEAHDAEQDQLVLLAMANGFVLETAGMKLTETSNADGVLTGTLEWNAYCDIYDFTNRTNFQLELMVDDDDLCDFNEPDTLEFDLSVILPGNADPFADTDLTTNPQEHEVRDIQRHVLQNLSFNVTANDPIDNDLVTIRLAGRDFKPPDYGMTFEKKSGTGQASSVFGWNLGCDKVNASTKSKFELLFIAIDSTNRCRVNKRDTVRVFVDVLPPVNKPPTIEIASLNPSVPYNDGDIGTLPGQQIRLSMTVRDDDVAPPEQVRLDLVTAEGIHPPEGFTFTPVNGPSPQTATFEWSPDCTIFTDDVFSNDYLFRFIYMDNHCQTEMADTVAMRVNIRDVASQDFEIEPPNVFTPNGDTFNDYFAMERVLGEEIISLLPPDNCLGQFQTVRIYNRWGKEVFSSTDRNFRWYGTDESAGVYYYYIYYTNREYKGTVSLRY